MEKNVSTLKINGSGSCYGRRYFQEECGRNGKIFLFFSYKWCMHTACSLEDSDNFEHSVKKSFKNNTVPISYTELVSVFDIFVLAFNGGVLACSLVLIQKTNT